MNRMCFIAAALAVAASKHTITLHQERPELAAPKLKASSNYKWCPFQDSVDYVCVDTTVNLKAGWKITQSWTTATDINPPAVTQYTGTSPASAFTYVAPNVVADVGYKYKLRLQPYATFVANIIPQYKINALLQEQL